ALNEDARARDASSAGSAHSWCGNDEWRGHIAAPFMDWSSLCSSESHRSELNRRPLDYESSALPLSYCGNAFVVHALARTRTATPCGTTPSRWRVYQFHHQGIPYP